jgi:hypothetical protein
MRQCDIAICDNAIMRHPKKLTRFFWVPSLSFWDQLKKTLKNFGFFSNGLSWVTYATQLLGDAFSASRAIGVADTPLPKKKS